MDDQPKKEEFGLLVFKIFAANLVLVQVFMMITDLLLNLSYAFILNEIFNYIFVTGFVLFLIYKKYSWPKISIGLGIYLLMGIFVYTLPTLLIVHNSSNLFYLSVPTVLSKYFFIPLTLAVIGLYRDPVKIQLKNHLIHSSYLEKLKSYLQNNAKLTLSIILAIIISWIGTHMNVWGSNDGFASYNGPIFHLLIAAPNLIYYLLLFSGFVAVMPLLAGNGFILWFLYYTFVINIIIKKGRMGLKVFMVFIHILFLIGHFILVGMMSLGT